MTSIPTTKPLSVRSALSTHVDPDMAAEQIAESLAQPANTDDLILAFVGGSHAKKTESVSRTLRAAAGPRHLIAISTASNLQRSQEIEDTPSVSAIALSIPNGSINTFNYQDLPHAEPDDPIALDEIIQDTNITPNTKAILLFADPFSFPSVSFLSTLDAAINQTKEQSNINRDIPIIGGMASWAISAGHNTLVNNARVSHTGAIGITIEGPLSVDTVVSQGCRPVGKPMVITEASKNIVKKLGGKVAIDAIRDIVDTLQGEDKDLLNKGLQFGIVINEYKDHFGRGDFLVRPVIGIDQLSGSVAIGERIRVGQTIQLHVRDAATATEDLKLTLQTQELYGPAAGGLLITCKGRGKALFDAPSHDAAIVSRTMSRINQIDDDAPQDQLPPLAGFHAHAEFAPLSGRTHVHNHTATVALFREDSAT